MTTKLQKIWKLTDQITNLEQVFNCRDDACDFEHSDTIIEQGYFITAEQLEMLIVSSISACVSDVPDILAELGVEDE